MALKRLFDILISGLALVVLSPLLIGLLLAVKLTSSGPALFRQQRVGLYGRQFLILKFRSMREDQPVGGLQITAKGDPRITRLGRVLRRTKLDEIPQLFNVLLGDMSLVGPRPEVSRYVDFYPPEAKQLIFQVRPGITDLASIEFRDEEAILGRAEDRERTYIEEILPKKIAYYCDYVANRSFRRDLVILIKTVAAVLS